MLSWKHVYWISHIVMLGRTETIGLGEELMLTVANKLQSRRLDVAIIAADKN